jgi:hypothetical protein
MVCRLIENVTRRGGCGERSAIRRGVVSPRNTVVNYIRTEIPFPRVCDRRTRRDATRRDPNWTFSQPRSTFRANDDKAPTLTPRARETNVARNCVVGQIRARARAHVCIYRYLHTGRAHTNIYIYTRIRYDTRDNVQYDTLISTETHQAGRHTTHHTHHTHTHTHTHT